jgi:4-carboxymuconolactone decarboxylase
MSYDPLDHDFERGMRNRRSVLGDAWVDRSVANATNFNADFQNLITRFAWNEIWGRPGLDHKTRRIIVLAITIALGRWEEFELHVRAGLTADPATRLTPDEMKEVMIQASVYAGVPAGNTAFTHAQKILREVGEQIGYAVVPQAPAASVHPGVGREGRTASSPALHYTVREPRNGKAPRHTVVLSHALGTDLMMWDGLANLLAADCRVIAYDHRGHGSSEKLDGLYSMADLADDAARCGSWIPGRWCGWACPWAAWWGRSWPCGIRHWCVHWCWPTPPLPILRRRARFGSSGLLPCGLRGSRSLQMRSWGGISMRASVLLRRLPWRAIVIGWSLPMRWGMWGAVMLWGRSILLPGWGPFACLAW